MAEGVGIELSMLVAHRLSGLTCREVWLRYLTLGGNADETSLEPQIHGVLDLPGGEYNVLAHAPNEALDDAPGYPGAGRVAYRCTVRERNSCRR